MFQVVPIHALSHEELRELGRQHADSGEPMSYHYGTVYELAYHARARELNELAGS